MQISKESDGSLLKLQVVGRVDSTTAPELEEAIMSEVDSISDLVLDFEKLEYISSAGLRVLLNAQKSMNAKGSMKLKNVNDTIMEVFEITGFSDILTIE